VAGNQLFLRDTWEGKQYMHTRTYTCRSVYVYNIECDVFSRIFQ